MGPKGPQLDELPSQATPPQLTPPEPLPEEVRDPAAPGDERVGEAEAADSFTRTVSEVSVLDFSASRESRGRYGIWLGAFGTRDQKKMIKGQGGGRGSLDGALLSLQVASCTYQFADVALNRPEVIEDQALRQIVDNPIQVAYLGSHTCRNAVLDAADQTLQRTDILPIRLAAAVAPMVYPHQKQRERAARSLMMTGTQMQGSILLLETSESLSAEGRLQLAQRYSDCVYAGAMYLIASPTELSAENWEDIHHRPRWFGRSMAMSCLEESKRAMETSGE